VSQLQSTRAADVVLGITLSHDAGAALVVDGRIVTAVNEERLTRRKQQMGFPTGSIRECLRLAGLSPSAVTRVAIGARHLATYPTTRNDLAEEDGSYRGMVALAEFINRLPLGGRLISSRWGTDLFRLLSRIAGHPQKAVLSKQLAGLGIDAPLFAYDHHDCHLAGAYFSSGMPTCLVISNDGFGDALCAKVSVGENGRLRELSRISFASSLGILYGFATALCGFPKIHHAGKTTGLAANGDWRKTIDIFRGALSFDESRGNYQTRLGVFRLGYRKLVRQLAAHSREDIAAGVQKHSEEILLGQLRYFRRQTGLDHVALAGGVHANVRANQLLAEEPGLKELYVFPNMGDGGLAAGAALLDWSACHPVQKIERLEGLYMGPGIDAADAEERLRREGLEFYRPDDMVGAIAELLAHNHIVARCEGSMEYGPRALGNRSILYAATDPTANDWLNARLGRSEFMPFAPVMRDVDAGDMIEGDRSVAYWPEQFMTVTFNATERCKRESPACVHVDGTLRPQVIRREVNPAYYDILTEYKKRTGLSTLVNTSFNMHEEPIVCSAEDAIRAFVQSGLDNLVLGPFIARHPQSEKPLQRTGSEPHN
jgi:carbamoyltransferase